MAGMTTGDCLREMREIPDASIDVVLTDPPYSSGARREAGRTVRTKVMTPTADAADWFGTDSLSTRGFAFLIRECALEWHRVLKPGGHVLCFIDWRMCATCSDAIESADLRPLNLIVWDKGRIGMGRHFRHQHELVLHFSNGDPVAAQRRDVPNVIQAKPPSNQGSDHPTQKPLALLREMLSVVCPPGGRVLDPFAGSGGTGIAARSLDREFVLIERQAEYVAQRDRAEARDGWLFER